MRRLRGNMSLAPARRNARGRTSFAAACATMLTAWLLAASANGQAPEQEVARDLIRADLPLFRYDDEKWPRPFHDEGTFGCTSRVAFGDWLFRQQLDTYVQTTWYRFTSFGAMHCWANAYRAYERDALNHTDARPSYFVFLERANINGSEVELWALQIGTLPGSEYLLLARAPGDELIEAFHMLQTDCPRRSVRDAGPLDILSTRYCAINTRRELIRLARRMAQRPALGTLAKIADEQMLNGAIIE